MTNIKVECGCGQRYAFETEPVNGAMASSVACPSCGADGTAAANAILARQSSPPSAPPPEPVAAASPGQGRPLKLTHDASPVAAPSRVTVDARTLGLVDRDTAETQARAKISWGDSPDEVTKYLMLQGFSVPEASELVQVLFKERLAALRVKGVRKIVSGIGLMCVPVIAFLFFAHFKVYPLKLLAIAVMVGLWGCWLALNGTIMLIAPKMESGDVAE